MTTVDEVAYGVDAMWVLFCAIFIVLMQAGFALIETGSVQHKNSVGILSKNVLNGLIAVICYWVLGYGFAFGNTKGGFIGVSLYGLAGDHFDVGDSWHAPLQFQYFFIQWAYAAVAVTIVGGALAERCKLQTYLIVAFAVAIWIYPIIVHWCWGQGWLSPHANQTSDYLFYGNKSNNFIDMAGSGVVHTVGGVAALVGAVALGARKVTDLLRPLRLM
jgi:Amt family ammonium transporter